MKSFFIFLVLFLATGTSYSMDDDDTSETKASHALWTLREDVKSALGLDSSDATSFAPSRKRPAEVLSPPYESLDVGYYLLDLDFTRRSKNLGGTDITPLKLQKLLYYAQGYSLAFSGSPLFEEDFRKWKNGPVLGEVYHQFSFRRTGISPKQSILTHCRFDQSKKPLKTTLREYCDKIGKREQKYLKTVYEMYLNESGESLSEKTHSERPWQETQDQDKIEMRLMTDFFKGPIAFDFIIGAAQHQTFEGPEIMRLISSVQKSLESSSESCLEHYRKSLTTLEEKNIFPILEAVLRAQRMQPFLFEGQTSDQAVLGQFFFPALLENGFEPPFIYFQHRTLPTLLAFSAHFENPVAIFYFSKMFRGFDYENAAESSLNKAESIFQKTLEKQRSLPASVQNRDLMGTCLTYLAEILDEKGEYGESGQALLEAIKLLSTSENQERLFWIAKRVKDLSLKRELLLRAYKDGQGVIDALIILASLEKDLQVKSSCLQEAILRGSAQACYTFGGLILQEDPTSQDAIYLLTEAIKRGSFGAALHLADKVPSQAEVAYDLAFEYGFQNANYHKYQFLISQNDLENAKKSLIKAGPILRDETLLEGFSETEKEHILDDVETYFDTLSKISKFDLTSSPSSSPSNGAEELSRLLDEDE